MSRKGICNSINNLIERNILTVLQKPSFNTPRKLMYQKDHTKWKGMPQKDDNIDTKENEYLAATESENHSTVESEYSSTVEAECHSTVEAEYHQERKNKENIKKYMSRSDLNEPFERFRKAYPKRQAKQDAMKAFIKLDPDETLLTVMIEAVTRHKASEGWQKNGGQYIPLAATRLNGKRREDEITETEVNILKPKRILLNENDLWTN